MHGSLISAGQDQSVEVDVLLFVLQKLVPKPTPRENGTEQKTTSAPNTNRLFK